MTHLQTLLWLCAAGYGVHVLEEFVFDWRRWSQQVLHLPTRWKDFYITNWLVIVASGKQMLRTDDMSHAEFPLAGIVMSPRTRYLYNSC